MENIFVLILSLFKGLCMFDGIAEQEGRKTELPIAIFLRITFFSTVSF